MEPRPSHRKHGGSMVPDRLTWLAWAAGMLALGHRVRSQDAPDPLCNCPPSSPCYVQANVTCIGPTIRPGATAYFRLDPVSLDIPTCMEDGSMLRVELWDTGRLATGDVVAEPHLFAAPEQDPKIDQLTLLQSNYRTFIYQPAEVASNSASSEMEEGTVADSLGFRLQRPYHSVELATPNKTWHTAVTNVGNGLLVRTQDLVDARIKMSCVAKDATCPAASIDGKTCGGRGTCQMLDGSPRCRCEPGWGGYSCTETVPSYPDYLVFTSNSPDRNFVPLETIVKESTLDGMEWAHMLLEVKAKTTTVIVELERYRGEALLYVKPEAAGSIPYDVPQARDHAFSSLSSYKEHSNYHWTILQLPETDSQEPRRIYVSILSPKVVSQETTYAQIRVTAQDPVLDTDVGTRGPLGTSNARICPWDCFTHGKCESSNEANEPTSGQNDADAGVDANVCVCDSKPGATWAGVLCQGQLIALDSDSEEWHTGNLTHGHWIYFQITPKNRKKARTLQAVYPDGLQLELQITATDQNKQPSGQPILVATAGDSVPTLVKNDWIFNQRTSEIGGTDLDIQAFTVGLFNMDIYRHENLSYKFRVRATSSESGQRLSAGVAIALSVGAGLVCLVCLIASVRYYRAFNVRMDDFEEMHMPAPLICGCPASVINSFATFTYDASLKPPKGTDGDDEKNKPVCSVCLIDFESGAVLRHLPCGHDFHQKCIDEWLANHTTCPNCRIPLVTPGRLTPPSATLSPAESQSLGSLSGRQSSTQWLYGHQNSWESGVSDEPSGAGRLELTPMASRRSSNLDAFPVLAAVPESDHVFIDADHDSLIETRITIHSRDSSFDQTHEQPDMPISHVDPGDSPTDHGHRSADDKTPRQVQDNKES